MTNLIPGSQILPQLPVLQLAHEFQLTVEPGAGLEVVGVVWKGLRYKDAANAVFYHGDCAFDAAFTPRVIGVKMQLDSRTIVSCSSKQSLSEEIRHKT